MTATDNDFNCNYRGLAGENFAIKRYLKYTKESSLIWLFHSHYRKNDIYRAFRGNDPISAKPLALYKIETFRSTLVSVNLSGIKEALKIYLGVFDDE